MENKSLRRELEEFLFTVERISVLTKLLHEGIISTSRDFAVDWKELDYVFLEHEKLVDEKILNKISDLRDLAEKPI
ncbi:MAG: hypothetical protein ACOX2H_01005 [Saccharofermentanales bacterium]|jgi:hypothetical protein